MRGLILDAIRFYQLTISPYMTGWCRFSPSCSNYAYESIRKYGVLKGIMLSTFRLVRCNPVTGSGGQDPVP